ncbi:MULTISPECIES: YhgE/Pip domain-containing protein [Clostridium]|uniref:YhgE/Pip domain-containing protein n=1 Tax=Clostridium senegalense TaxID=1465809 RepID=A0A6M0H427_9CLOT|nr:MULTISPECIES: YhgE/Pip domain-containing protein [Clostridium]NEU05455.1 YhgE/Pip domain-containing protein [Clostridium senegalense]
MKNIFQIYRRDLKMLFINYVAIIIILGLCILPSLYAWFNIKACWDPYGNTKGIKVAVVNKDSGYKFDNIDLKLGEEIVSELKNNHDIGWVFTDQKDADYGVNHGKYYASIIITETFSKDITSFLEKNPKKPQLIYNVNEKINAVAPKITEKGASSLQETVSKNFIEMVNGIIFENFNKIGVEIEGQRPTLKKLINVISNLNNNMDEIETVVNELYEGSITAKEFIDKIESNVPILKETLNSAIEVGNQSEKFIQRGKEDIDTIAPFVKESLIFVRDKAKEINIVIEGIVDSTNGVEVTDGLKRIRTLFYNMDAKITNLVDTIDRINNVANNEVLEQLSAQLKNFSQRINEKIQVVDQLIKAASEGQTIGKDALEGLKDINNDIINFLDGKINSFDSEIKPALDNVINKLNTIIDNSLNLLNEAKGDIPKVEQILEVGEKGSELGIEGIEELKKNLPYIRETLSKINDKTTIFQDEKLVDRILELLKIDPNVAKTFISTPVELVENDLYKIPNYGSAMSPFYTVLAIWVGTLILSSILTVDVYEFDDKRILKNYEKFFGKYLFFLTIALIQGLIVAIGDKYLLGCYIVNMKLFIISTIISSVVFSMIVYTLVSVFGNVGKAIGVILLVLQVAGSGGTFPIEVTPPFFQAINPFLPFTYAIGVMREAVAGPIRDNVIYDIKMLVIYFIGAVFIGVILKKPLDNITEKFNKKFKESGLSE